MSDYERIARIIRWLVENQEAQPRLEDLAAEAGLSLFHFHRLFTTWAAVTPKDFLQCLTVAHARQRLKAGESVMTAAFSTGLSGPGRLHDLCVSLEAATPGELKSGGAGWEIVAGFSDSPFGRMLVAEGPRGICHLSFDEQDGEAEAWEHLRKDWPSADLKRDDEAANALQMRIFQPKPESGGSLRAWVQGTPFQVRVWRALLQIPPGNMVSYRSLASGTGHPGAARAVGTAVGKNPLAYLIPCHRVIRETGVIGDYRWGHVRKRAMLAWESPRSAQDPAEDELFTKRPETL